LLRLKSGALRKGQRLRKMLRFETLLWDEGQDAVAGVDEAGMSPLAVPVSAAAVILKPGTRITVSTARKRWMRIA
jgi:ribonuclease HII